jgi:hypothetical protein
MRKWLLHFLISPFPPEFGMAEEEGKDQGRERREPAPIDVEKLAERVYRLMQAEARLERARGERTGPPRKT